MQLGLNLKLFLFWFIGFINVNQEKVVLFCVAQFVPFVFFFYIIGVSSDFITTVE